MINIRLGRKGHGLGSRYLTGDKVKTFWAEFSSVSLAVLLRCRAYIRTLLELKTRARLFAGIVHDDEKCFTASTTDLASTGANVINLICFSVQMV
jgi:hypothetical protein